MVQFIKVSWQITTNDINPFNINIKLFGYFKTELYFCSPILIKEEIKLI
jgi:hypothetical protein